MSRGLQAGLLTAALLVLAVVSGCSGTSEESPVSPTPTTSVSPTPTLPPSPSPASESEVAAANAEAVLRDYIALSDALRSNADAPLEDLADVATSLELDSQMNFLSAWREKGWKLTGTTDIVELDFVDVSLDNSNPTAGRVPTATFELCYDVSEGDVVDPSGNSVVPPDRPTRGWTRYLVSNYQWATDPVGAWRVASSETLEREPCDAA